MSRVLSVAAGLFLALCVAPVATAATTYDLNLDFASAPFQYGQGEGGISFTPFARVVACNDFNICYSNGSTTYPQIMHNPTASDWNVNFGEPFGSLTVPAFGINLNPDAPGNENSDVIVRFIAPTGGNYDIGGAFLQLGTNNGYSDGTLNSIFHIAGGTPSLLFSATQVQAEQFAQSAFNLNIMLGQGDFLDFVVNPRGDAGFDQVGLTGIISTSAVAAVPEPATWVMMIAGFGVVGATLRRRRAEGHASYA